ncbi:unnamed protein product [Didymodactylos carnosus]|uniref:Uncharacterized protein n=1 Tax=Didymodactylos carnosus TaxID=1234261 RepID=A0A815PUS3_9BILA|nr:unnamed protein product [Didymodactylos carnosus]CAF1471736.1 unnamed protein product [Didymodactylos carnosus]CAF4263438.1 unnamed protein product [Didymodactylos carnosus]CAF4327062.1 unnamed protein product [Didymodactylos carnosus]
MALADGLRIIWLDTHIGVIGEYQALKNQFRAHLQPVAAMPPNSINELICCFEKNVAPIEFVATNEDALALIEYEKDKRIIFISSGILGKEIIPTIVSRFQRVDSFYIFCGYMKGLVEWALEHGYEHNMQMFDHEKDLLIRLVRDTSDAIIKLGQSYMDLQDGKSALKCFMAAEELEMQENTENIGHPPSLDRLKKLNELIQQAKDLKDHNS